MAMINLGWALDQHAGNWALEAMAGETFLAAGDLVEASSHAVRSLELGSDSWGKDILKRLESVQPRMMEIGVGR